MAWAYRALGDSVTARIFALEGVDSSTPLARARGRYILALLSHDERDTNQAIHHIELARSLYDSLGRTGGVDLCNSLLVQLSNASKRTGGMGPGAEPPRDDGDA